MKSKKLNIYLYVLVLVAFFSCNQEKSSSLVRMDFGTLRGNTVDLYSLGFEGGLKADITNYGLIVTSLSVPDKNGKVEDIVLGYDDLESYLEETPYFGAIVGRYGNRIDSGRFYLDSVEYTLAINNGPNHLHGGLKGFDKVLWEVVDAKRSKDSISLKFRYVSADGEEGYPGELTTTVEYVFTPNSFGITYSATTDAPTVVNLTQHTYWNLSGDPNKTILDHELRLDATKFLPVDSTLIPTGELRPVIGTPFDFTKLKVIGTDIEVKNQQLTFGGGYDHCWIFDDGVTNTPRKVAEVYYPGNGRVVEVSTTEPAIQFYTGNFLDGTLTGKDGIAYQYRTGLCLETEHYPDSPNQPDFPSVVLNPGETYNTTTIYSFSTR
ncbi:MAG: aldose epimerase family protein [Bacteroidota bacterium]